MGRLKGISPLISPDLLHTLCSMGHGDELGKSLWDLKLAKDIQDSSGTFKAVITVKVSLEPIKIKYQAVNITTGVRFAAVEEVTLMLADANFPTSSVCRDGPKEVRADGHSIPALLEAILQLMPLDTYCWSPASVMDVTDSDRCKGLSDPPVWQQYRKLLKEAEKRDIPLQTMERFDFYDRARKAFAIVQTGETSLYGNIILKMGVIPETK